jgi:hypothetical protein
VSVFAGAAVRFFFRCVAEAIAENGMKGLAEMVLGGKFAYDVAEGVWKKYRERRKEDEQREELAKLAQATLEEAKAEAGVIAREVAGGAVDDIIDLELYLTAIPDAVRQSLKRPEDPSGTTVPATFALKSADDVLKLLPARPPRFRPGAALPGMAGWVLDRLLGTGGFGEVWFARHARMGSLSGAVKFCFGQSGQDLIHEAELIDRIMAAGKHPNIVPLTHAHLEGDCPWLMFEYVGGGTLADYIHRLAERMTVNRVVEAVAMLTLLGEAVECFHSLPEPVVHRDLKPSNILLDSVTKRYRITDFGIGALTARETNRLESQGLSTRGGHLLSVLRGSYTPLYSSPQQRRGVRPDPRDDVHALGVIAYQMLVGALDAAPGPRALQTLKKMEVPDVLAELVVNCTSEDPTDRPATAGELVRRLRELRRRELEEFQVDVNEFALCETFASRLAFVQERAATRFNGWLTEAKSGEVAAMNLVACALSWSAGVPGDVVAAARWWRRAANLGHAPSMCDLAMAHRLGSGVEKSDAEMSELLLAARALNSARAIHLIGEARLFGEGMCQDIEASVDDFLEAANHGFTPAMIRFAQAYEHGRGLESSRTKALKWYRAAAEKGSEEAIAALKRLRSKKRPDATAGDFGPANGGEGAHGPAKSG